MATVAGASGARGQEQMRLVQNLMNVQRAAQAISSVLDLDALNERIVEEVSNLFECVETFIWLRDDATNEMVLAAFRGCTCSTKHQRLAIGQGGIVGHVAANGRTYYAPDIRLDPHNIPCEPDIRSEIHIPLLSDGRVIGVFSAACDEVNAFSAEHIQVLEAMGGHIAIAVANATRFREERLERERMQRDAEEARTIQQALFPKFPPRVPGFRIEGKSVPAGAVGGDWYDYLPLTDGRVGIVLADVSGKGMAAALLMSATRGILRSLAGAHSTSPGEVLERLNQALLADIPSGRFVTMVFAVLDPAARTVSFANAGHPWPILVEPSGARFLQTASGLPLGLAPTAFSEHRVDFNPGSRLLFYSDGITESTRKDNEDEEFGVARLQERVVRDCSAEELIREVCEFTGGRGPTDDATVIFIHALEPGELPPVRHPL